MSDFTPIKKIALSEAIAQWNQDNPGKNIQEEENVDLIFRAISELDTPSLNLLKSCKKLSLSSNFIAKIPEMHFDNLQILSLGRNKIKAIRGLDFLGKSLLQLWISYNEIEKLDGLKSLINLKKLFIGNNLIGKIDELNTIASLPLEEVVFQGNPFSLIDPSSYATKPQEKKWEEYMPEVKKRLPNIKTLDGTVV